jgi:hypothetical protein
MSLQTAWMIGYDNSHYDGQRGDTDGQTQCGKDVCIHASSVYLLLSNQNLFMVLKDAFGNIPFADCLAHFSKINISSLLHINFI